MTNIKDIINHKYEVTVELKKAGNLANWLINTKGTGVTQAYIIAARKYKIINWHDVQKYYNENLKPKQTQI